MPSDQAIRCASCGVAFLWTWAEQADDSPPPDRCPMCRQLAPDPGRQRGLVKWYSRAKGYGFITPVAGPELFFHKTGLADGGSALSAGTLVEFSIGRGPRGAQAESVQPLSPAGQ